MFCTTLVTLTQGFELERESLRIYFVRLVNVGILSIYCYPGPRVRFFSNKKDAFLIKKFDYCTYFIDPNLKNLVKIT